MDIYLKYWPLIYTWNTRFSHEWDKKVSLWKLLLNAFSYLFIAIWIWWLSLIYFYINWDISLGKLIWSILLYGIIFLIYTNFYEIWYLHNSIVAKKEKNPTIRIYEKVPKNFYTIQILIRIIIWCFCVLWLYFFGRELWIMLFIIILLTEIVYCIHNVIRSYFYNYMTLLILRILKFSLIFIILYYIFWNSNSDYYLYLSVLFLLYQQFDHVCRFNKRMWWTNKLWTNIWQYFYSFVSCLFLYLLTNSNLFIYFWIIYFIVFVILTPKSSFSLKNSR